MRVPAVAPSAFPPLPRLSAVLSLLQPSASPDGSSSRPWDVHPDRWPGAWGGSALPFRMQKAVDDRG